jgi:hypothetical protein
LLDVEPSLGRNPRTLEDLKMVWLVYVILVVLFLAGLFAYMRVRGKRLHN